MSYNLTQINKQKRSFLKTLILSFAFISFGGLGSFLKTTFLDSSNQKSKSGFGSNGYGM
jgi:hypothetical protein